tara:strand:- start:5 stop:1132 length:1128 start_codon:yes stop_codon:yes gene_type:complete
MQLFRLYKAILLTNIFLVGSVNAESIGQVIEQTGTSALVRNNETIAVSQTAVSVELYDEAKTANGRMKVEFLDKAELSLTEHSTVYIDEIYYDPDPSKSKMSMRMAMGTARFASGKLSMVNKNNIDIQTPTATIGIRGTDFTTTIDELGRSLIILLPDEYGNSSGEITVSNEAGVVTMTEAYETTMVSTISSMPTAPVIVTGITPNLIDNMFIVNPPSEVKDAIQEQAQDDANQDQGLLDIDFLEFNDLEQDYLNDETELEFTELDIDMLNVDFLTDLLDIVEALDRKIKGSGEASGSSISGVSLQGATIGLNPDSQYNVFVEGEDIIFQRMLENTIVLRLKSGANISIETIVEGYEGIIELNEADEGEIIIRQQ